MPIAICIVYCHNLSKLHAANQFWSAVQIYDIYALRFSIININEKFESLDRFRSFITWAFHDIFHMKHVTNLLGLRGLHDSPGFDTQGFTFTVVFIIRCL